MIKKAVNFNPKIKLPKQPLSDTRRMTENAIITIPKNLLSQLPAAKASGEIIVINNEKDIPKALEIIRESKLVGFDTETKPSFKKGHLNPVSLIQIATGKQTFLFRINITGLSQLLIDLLEDPDILKIGLSIHDDFHNLSKIRHINPSGFIDLQSYVRNFKIADSSLSKLYAILFDRRISKGQRLTNWEADILSPAQQAYAALDAEACITIYNYLKSGCFVPEESKYLTMPQPEEQKNEDSEI